MCDRPRCHVLRPMDDLEVFGLTRVGDHGTRLMLTGGANDVGGMLLGETSAGWEDQDGSPKTVEWPRALASSIGRPARQRTTAYGAGSAERLNAAASFDDTFRRQLRIFIATA